MSVTDLGTAVNAEPPAGPVIPLAPDLDARLTELEKAIAELLAFVREVRPVLVSLGETAEAVQKGGMMALMRGQRGAGPAQFPPFPPPPS